MAKVFESYLDETLEAEGGVEIPESDPRGFSDLRARFLIFGYLTSDGDFVRASTLDNDRMGAYKFEVKNVGTKTSAIWQFSALLPDSTTYEQEGQAELRPNERAVITIGFPVTETGTATLGVTVTAPGDTNSTNNTFSETVLLTE